MIDALVKKTAVECLREALMRNLMDAALGISGSNVDSFLEAAAMLERGDRCPFWMAEPVFARSMQDVFGSAGMLIRDDFRKDLASELFE